MLLAVIGLVSALVVARIVKRLTLIEDARFL